ncbi:MAG: DUF1778 domain-containing protein [Boseongicola sp.]|nr:DUF1778 domain-containing protein [Boseongicola sp.]
MLARPNDTQRMSRAAELTGARPTTFVRAPAVREAERVLREHQDTVLSKRDRATPREALDNPPPPTMAAWEAARGNRSRIANAG